MEARRRRSHDVTAIVIAILAAIAVSVLGRDAWGWLPRFSRGVVWLQTAPLPRDRRELRREEWHAELDAQYDDRRVTGLLWTLTLVRISAWERLTTPISVRGPRTWPSARVRGPVDRSATGYLALGAIAFCSSSLFIAALWPYIGAGRTLLHGALMALVGGVPTALCIVAVRNYGIRRSHRRAWVLEVLADLGHVSSAESIDVVRRAVAGFQSTQADCDLAHPADQRLVLQLTRCKAGTRPPHQRP